MNIFISGIAGFIGFHLARYLAEKGKNIIGIDNINNYYDPKLKLARLKELGFFQNNFNNGKILKSNKFKKLKFAKIDLYEKDKLQKIFFSNKIDIVCNLAAQAGVRYSSENPKAYIHSNVVGYLNLLECCMENNINRFIYASSSSVYGDSKELPFKENIVLSPKNLYAKTKKINEDIADIYSSLGLSCIGLRFFSVYGTWGRPDMVLMTWLRNIFNDSHITIYGDGEMKRDFTFVGDVIKCIEKIIDMNTFEKSKNNIYNIGSSNPIKLKELAAKLEYFLRKKIDCKYVDKPIADIEASHSDCSKINQLIGYKPETLLDSELGNILEWYKNYYK